MKKEEGQKNIVGDSENDDRDNVISEPLRSAPSPPVAAPVQASPPPPTPRTAPVQALVPRGGGANWVNKAKDVIREDEVFEGPTKNVPKKQDGSPSHAIDIYASGTLSTESGWCMDAITEKVDLQNGPRYDYTWIKDDLEPRYDYTGIKDDLEGDNSTLVLKLKSYKKWPIEPEQKILKVPTMLPREIHESHSVYDPKIVAIGPYHNPCYTNDNPKLNHKLKQMEAIKIQFTLEYTNQSEKSIEKLYEEMEELLIVAKNQYDKHVIDAFDNKKFAEMMFIDSCFLIQFMNSCVYPEKNNIKITYLETSLIMRDIMLLENQLPFKILIELMNLSSRFKDGIGDKMINEFIKLIMNDFCTEEAPRRKTCFGFCKTNSKSKATTKEKKKPIHLLELVQTKFVDDEEIRNGTRKKPSSNWCSYRSVKELKSVGIHLQCSEKSRRFSDITFDYMLLYGRLSLPHITIDDGTKSLLLNLVAFEACDTQSNFGVSSYVYFMDTLIDHAEDVKELRSKGVILNLLGSDQQVADLFNEISENLVPDSEVFGNVKHRLNNFYTSHRRLWLAECLHNHFRSPWAIIAFFAAIVVLGLTIAQTVFSAIQL
ncbi:putative UPF0481 protein At3g02645 isoform X2 [Diospyros lotus]|uniref:putative UPF0481 protein At3g02645 isoform X2 n=1 Tax=Diospyros lotus TaxID=55363 RepID=UPI002251E73E|nr:putative UPF0481 protein At3g02645 isoform X2 [Diospyros lotus]